MKRILLTLVALSVALGGSARAQEKASENKRTVLEEIVARVNNEIITLSDLKRSQRLLRQELSQKSSGAQLEEEYKKQASDLLRDLIDEALLVQRAADMGLSVESDVIKRLDRIRQEMGLATLEELQQAVAQEGLNFEDFRQQIRNQILTQTVVQNEVMGKIFVDADRVRQYYDEHKEELAQPERVRLQEILIAKPEDDERAREERMREVLTKVRLGEEFDELAREHSDAPTAEDGGELGYFEPEKLAPAIRDAIANLQEEGVADPLLTRDGWLLLKLVEHRKPGIPPFEEVEIELRNRVYMDEMRPLMREFMTDMRREAYVKVKSGYTDTGAPPDMQQPGARRATIRTKRRRPGS